MLKHPALEKRRGKESRASVWQRRHHPKHRRTTFTGGRSISGTAKLKEQGHQCPPWATASSTNMTLLNLPAHERQGNSIAVTHETCLPRWLEVSLHIHYSPMLQNYQTIPPGERRGWGMLYTEPRQEPVITRTGPSFFKPKSQASPLPLLPHMCALFKARADRHRQPTARCVPAGTLSGPRACVSALRALPRLASPCISLSFLLPSLLASAFQPSQMCYQIRGKKCPLSQVHLCGYPVFSLFRSVQTRRPPICMFWLCLYIYETTPFSRTDARGQSCPQPPRSQVSVVSGSSAGWRLPFLTSTTSWRQEVAWSP